MPTERRVESAIITISEMLEELKYEVQETLGPEKIEAEKNSNIESSTLVYYLVARARDSTFYITFRTDTKIANIVYQMDVLSHLTQYLDRKEVATIIEDDPNWDEIPPEQERELYLDAIREIIQNTDQSKIHRPAFTLSAHSSTSFVDFLAERAENGFPVQFQCTRAMFPYSGELSIQAIDDRVYPVIVAGRRGRRYVEHSFRIEKEGLEPTEYEFAAII